MLLPVHVGTSVACVCGNIGSVRPCATKLLLHCSNEFSTFAHKTVYFDFYTDEDDDVFIPEEGAHHEALTQLESSVVSIHDTLKVGRFL